MPVIEGVLFCDGCGAEIPGAPVLRGETLYCCEDCADGMACDCALILADEGWEQAASTQPGAEDGQRAVA